MNVTTKELLKLIADLPPKGRCDRDQILVHFPKKKFATDGSPTGRSFHIIFIWNEMENVWELPL